jgi:hypothetical protein
MTATLNAKSEAILTSMGVKDVNVFVLKQSKKILEEEIKEMQDKVDFYEQKYGMNYQEFIVRVMDKSDPVLSKFGIIEKEDDDFDWDAAIRFQKSYSQKLESIFEPVYA